MKSYPRLTPRHSGFFLCSRVETSKILVYPRWHNPIFSKNLKQRQYAFKRQGKALKGIPPLDSAFADYEQQGVPKGPLLSPGDGQEGQRHRLR